MTNIIPVDKSTCYQKVENPFFEFDLKRSIENQQKLIDFVDELKIIQTKNKWKTWGRTYIEVPPNVLNVFGVSCNYPITFYLNTVDCVSFFYAYIGEIFSGDAAWFDNYFEISKKKISDNINFKKVSELLENKGKKHFSEYLDTNPKKWEIVPVYNLEKAKIAESLNTHI